MAKVFRSSSRRAFRGNVCLGHASIYDKIASIDETALVAGKEHDRMRLLDGLAEPACREVNLAAVTLGLVIT